ERGHGGAGRPGRVRVEPGHHLAVLEGQRHRAVPRRDRLVAAAGPIGPAGVAAERVVLCLRHDPPSIRQAACLPWFVQYDKWGEALGPAWGYPPSHSRERKEGPVIRDAWRRIRSARRAVVWM